MRRISVKSLSNQVCELQGRLLRRIGLAFWNHSGTLPKKNSQSVGANCRSNIHRSLCIVALTLLVLCLLASGCSGTSQQIQPIRFYYLVQNPALSSGEEIIRFETRDLGTKSYSNYELFRLYMRGPVSNSLISPFSIDADLSGVYRVGSTLEIRLTTNMNASSELKHTLAFACLAKTGLELEGVRKVHIHLSSFDGSTLSDMTLTQSDILLFDSGELPESMEMILYFADQSGKLLQPEKRQIPIQDPTDLPQKALELLLTAPETAELCSPLPSGTAILDLSVDNGICTVDFNGDFLNNRPKTEQGEQLAILSVVNTLCELDGINQVLIYVEGRPLEPYLYLNLSSPWISDGSVIGPIREEQGDFFGTLCLPGQEGDLLHRLQIRATARGSNTRELTLLLALLERSSQNGLQNPLTGMDPPLSCQTNQGICRIVFAPHQLPTEELERELCLRCISATLCSLPSVDAVEVSAGGILLTSIPLRPRDDWFLTGSSLGETNSASTK